MGILDRKGNGLKLFSETECRYVWVEGKTSVTVYGYTSSDKTLNIVLMELSSKNIT